MNILQTHKEGDDDKLLQDIAGIGWHVIMVEATDYLPGFAYTIGLWKNYNHPELISFGLSVKTLHSILNIGGDLAKSRQQIKAGNIYEDFFENSRTQILNVDKRNIADYFGYAIWFYEQKEFPALQLVWADRNNKFPWESNFEIEFENKQPLLDRNADYKFREAKNVAVFTTRQYLELGRPIIHVVHDFDGAWQFLTGDQMPEDIKIVCFEDIIKSDTTLNDIFNLDYGESARRDFPGAKWKRSVDEVET